MLSANTLVAELLDRSHQAAAMLINLHVECIGCSMNKFCTFEDMCRHHGLDLDPNLNLMQEMAGDVRFGLSIPNP